jgi:hypothetical protein
MKDNLKILTNIVNAARVSLEKASCITNLMIDSADGNLHDYPEDAPLMILDDYLNQIKIQLAELDEITDALKQA